MTFAVALMLASEAPGELQAALSCSQLNSELVFAEILPENSLWEVPEPERRAFSDLVHAAEELPVKRHQLVGHLLC